MKSKFAYDKNVANSEFYSDLYTLKEELDLYNNIMSLENCDSKIKENAQLKYMLKQKEFKTKYAVLLNKKSKHNKSYQEEYASIFSE